MIDASDWRNISIALNLGDSPYITEGAARPGDGGEKQEYCFITFYSEEGGNHDWWKSFFFTNLNFLIENLTNLGEKLRTVPMLSCDTDPKLERKLCSFDRSLGRDVEPSQSVDYKMFVNNYKNLANPFSLPRTGRKEKVGERSKSRWQTLATQVFSPSLYLDRLDQLLWSPRWWWFNTFTRGNVMKKTWNNLLLWNLVTRWLPGRLRNQVEGSGKAAGWTSEAASSQSWRWLVEQEMCCHCTTLTTMTVLFYNVF